MADPQFCALALVLVSTLAMLQSITLSLLSKVGTRKEDTAEDPSHFTLGLEVAPLEDLGTCVNRPLLDKEIPEFLGNTEAVDKITVQRRAWDDSRSCLSNLHGSLQLTGDPRVGASVRDLARPAKRKGEYKDQGTSAIDDLFNALT